MKFQYSVDQCDVDDKDQLKSFRSHLSEWSHMIEDDEQSVWNQIYEMMWIDAVFRSANAARGLARKYDASSKNYDLSSLIDRGYVSVQALAIRKLLEKSAKQPDKQVISLRRLLDDIKAKRASITREMYVANDGLPYDPTSGQGRFLEEAMARGSSGVWVSGLPLEGPEAWSASERKHEIFDRLSGVSPDKRNKSDLIQEALFVDMEELLENSGYLKIKGFVDKFVAHASDSYSRSSVDFPRGFSLDSIRVCHKAICRVAHTISIDILWIGSRGFIPVAQYDKFHALDRPWVKEADVEALSQFWDKHVSDTQEWFKSSWPVPITPD